MLSFEDKLKQITTKHNLKLKDMMNMEKNLEKEKAKIALKVIKENTDAKKDSITTLRYFYFRSFELFCNEELEWINMECQRHRIEVESFTEQQEESIRILKKKHRKEDIRKLNS